MKITITRPDGLEDVVVDAPVGAPIGTPASLGDDLFVGDLPDGKGVLFVNKSASERYRFSTIVTDQPVIYTEGSKRSLEGGTILIDDDPTGYRDHDQFILPEEAIPVLFHHEDHLWPENHVIALVKSLIDQTTGLEQIKNHPRLIKLLQNFEDKNQPLNIPFGETDQGWVLRHWHRTAGGEPKVGWFNGVCVRGSGGFDNWNYNGLLWLAMNYLENPQPSQWIFGMRSALAHACYGRHWGGKWAGMARYEKGDQWLGHNFSPDWAKQWSIGMIIWWVLSGNEILEDRVMAMKKTLLTVDPYIVYKGYWGSRIAARFLDELLVYYLVFKDQGFKDQAEKMIMNCLNLLDPTQTYWPNKGNNGAAEESPWMQSQLVTSIFRWYEHVPTLEASTGFTKDLLCQIGEDVMTNGSTKIYGGKPILKYRYHTTNVMPNSMHNTAFAMPMLRYMAGYDSKWVTLRDEVENFVLEYAGTDLSGIVAGTPTPVSQLGYRFPREGWGWNKVQRFYLDVVR